MASMHIFVYVHTFSFSSVSHYILIAQTLCLATFQ